MAGYLLDVRRVFSNEYGFRRSFAAQGTRVTKNHKDIETQREPRRAIKQISICTRLGSICVSVSLWFLMFSQAAYGDTVLNFVKATINGRLNASFSVANPTSNFADVQFTYYGIDGNPVSSGLVNPVRYRVAPKGQFSMRASELFAGSTADGWVQVTSTTSGLTGFYLYGDFATSLEGSDPAPGLNEQIVPVIRDDQMNKTELVIVNPGPVPSTVTGRLYNANGEQVGSIPSQVIQGHAALRLRSPILSSTGAGSLSARISASAPVAATAIVDRGDSLYFVTGQAVDQTATLRVAPHLITNGAFSERFNPVLALANPSGAPVQVKVTVFTGTGGLVSPAASSRTFNIPENGSLSADIRTITGQPIAPTVNGWLTVESGSVALAGVLILDQSQAVASIPLQTAPMDRLIFSQSSETQGLATGIVLVNPSAADAAVDVTLVRTDGTTSAQSSFTVAAKSKFMKALHDVFAEVVSETSGYIVIRSSAPLFAAGIIAGLNNSLLAEMPPAPSADTLTPGPVVLMPSIINVEPGFDVQPGTTLRLSVQNIATDATFALSGYVLNARQIGSAGLNYEVTIPALEPGFANLTVRSNGLESPPKRLRILGADSVPSQTVSGQAFYQKIDVTDAGLDLSHPVMVPIRNARIEVFSRSSQSVVAVSETDSRGRFSAPVPFDANLTVRVISRLRSSDLRVADNTNRNQLYAIAADFDGRNPHFDLLLADTSRLSGAFNILETIERANDTLTTTADPNLVPPAPTIFWSTRNWAGRGNINYAQGLIGTTTFNVGNNTAVVLGDRNDHGNESDSDEFDDAVILHEYAHLLAVKFSRDDSPGGSHMLGDMLDPRVAWSEGWANFFSSVVRNDPIWRDSRGPNGQNILRYDLEDNVPIGDRPGYWSEASVDTILWDLYDDHDDGADDVQYPFAEIWKAFVELRNDRFVYLPYFLEHFINDNPSAADPIRNIVQSRSIDFQPNVRPSVTYPFPSPINIGSAVTGFVDSLTSRRGNLVTSSHFYSFSTTGGVASIRLDSTGLGPGGNPTANDLDLFLMDVNGRVIERSDSGSNGQSERIALKIPEGTYVVEIRSYYTRAENGGFVFNSGQYRLSVSVQ
jgi:Family of unknown function (DUF5719)